METKEKVRHRYAGIRNGIEAPLRQEKEEAMKKSLLALEQFERADRVYTYVSYGGEADTREIIKESLRLGKGIFVPKVFPKRQMEFYRILSLEELSPGFHGIMEPGGEAVKRRDSSQAREGAVPALILLPGLCFDRQGNRLGYGGGFYDTYLAKAVEGSFFKLGFCFEEQVADRAFWQTEKTDIQADGLLTEAGYVGCRRKTGTIKTIGS